MITELFCRLLPPDPPAQRLQLRRAAQLVLRSATDDMPDVIGDVPFGYVPDYFPAKYRVRAGISGRRQFGPIRLRPSFCARLEIGVM